MKNLITKSLLCLFLPFFIGFLNWDLVEERFVSPVQDMESSIQSWDWEMSSEISATSQKTKKDHISEFLFSNALLLKAPRPSTHWNPGKEIPSPGSTSNFTFFFNLPPPSLA